MSIVSLPARLRIASFSVGQSRYDMQETSDVTGDQAARLFAPPRWRVAMASHTNISLAEAGQWEGLKLQLRGGINHLAVWDPVRTAPQGTLRGSPTLSSTAAAGATSLVLAGALGANLLVGGGFDLDANANDIADGWQSYSNGSQTITGTAHVAGASSPFAQQILFSDLGATSGDRVGFISGACAATPGQAYTMAYDAKGSHTGMQAAGALAWYTAADAFISSDNITGSALGAVEARYSVTAAAPPTAAFFRALVWVQENTLGAGSYSATFDNAHVGLQANGSAFAPPATLLRGDWLQVGAGLGTSQLVKVVADATANDSAAMTVTIEPPLRIQFASTTVVTSEKPLAYYKQVGDLQSSYGAGRTQGGFALDLLEAFG